MESDLGGRGLLDFIVQLAGELVKPLDSFAEFLLVLLQQRSFCGGDGLRVAVSESLPGSESPQALEEQAELADTARAAIRPPPILSRPRRPSP